jgi:Protein of unknown function (DUF4232)
MIAPPKPPAPDELEALIKEARERQLRRRLLGAAGVAVAAAVGLSLYASFSGATRTTAPTGRGRPLPAAARCSTAGGWKLALNGDWSEPTGQHTAPVVLKRLGSTACTLDGYPRVAMVGANGQVLHFRYSHHGDLVVAARPPHAVRIARNGSAYFLLNKYRCDVRDTGIARAMRVTLPGVRGRLVLHLPRLNPIIDYCPVAGPSTTIAVSPLVANLAQVTARLP